MRGNSLPEPKPALVRSKTFPLPSAVVDEIASEEQKEPDSGSVGGDGGGGGGKRPAGEEKPSAKAFARSKTLPLANFLNECTDGERKEARPPERSKTLPTTTVFGDIVAKKAVPDLLSVENPKGENETRKIYFFSYFDTFGVAVVDGEGGGGNLTVW